MKNKEVRKKAVLEYLDNLVRKGRITQEKAEERKKAYLKAIESWGEK